MSTATVVDDVSKAKASFFGKTWLQDDTSGTNGPSMFFMNHSEKNPEFITQHVMVKHDLSMVSYDSARTFKRHKNTQNDHSWLLSGSFLALPQSAQSRRRLCHMRAINPLVPVSCLPVPLYTACHLQSATHRHFSAAFVSPITSPVHV